MASIVWTSILYLLYFELGIVLILVVPVPRKVRNFIAKEIAKFNIGEEIAKFIIGIGLMLGLALLESFNTHRTIMARIYEETSTESGVLHSKQQHERMFHGQDRERKFKSERNMYLAGFSLTLLFVIGRITRLMQESVELEEEIDRVQKSSLSSKETKQEETQKQPSDKKKD